MSEPRVIVVKNHLSELERARRAVEAFGEEHGMPTTVIFQLSLALDELLTNVISYAYSDSAQHEIIVRLSVDAGRVVAEIEDDGRVFNPLAAAAPASDVPLAERPIGGLGIHLVRKVIDQLEYRREQGKNLLVLRKAIA